MFPQFFSLSSQIHEPSLSWLNTTDSLNCSGSQISQTMLFQPSLFDQIHDGTVMVLSINKADATHPMAAATLTFTTPESARQFFNRSHGAGIWVKDQKLFIRYNIRGIERHIASQTRVLAIEGPVEIMTPKYWTRFFGFRCDFTRDRIIQHHCPDQSRGRMEVRFMRLVISSSCSNAFCEICLFGVCEVSAD